MKNEKLPKGVRRRGDSLVACFTLANGEKERRSLGEVSVAYAAEQVAIFRRQVREGTYQPKQPKEQPLTVAELFRTYLDAYTHEGKRALWRQQAAWRHLNPVFGSLRVEQLTTIRFRDYQTMRLEQGASPATVNRELAALSASLYLAAKTTVEGGKPLLAYIPKFPSKLKESAPRSGFITDKQYKALAAVAKPLWLRAFLAAAHSFGFRRGELLSLRVEQVDFFGKWLVLETGTTKNGEGRKAHMTAEVFELIKACSAGKNPEQHVFTREDGTPVRDPREDWQAACVLAGLGRYVPATNSKGQEYQKYSGLTPHDLRRSAVRNMVRRGVPQSVAMKISGHKTAAVFRRYDIGDEADLIEATRKIEKCTKKSTSPQKPADPSPELPRM